VEPIHSSRHCFRDQIMWVAERTPEIITDLPPTHRLGGVSGGPLISWFETPSHVAHTFYPGSSPRRKNELENVVARRADFIADDGTIVEPQQGI
jgi:hypothetical protein